MLILSSWLAAIGLPVKEDHFKVPPALPYILFTQEATSRGGDMANLIVDREIDIELYSESIDTANEAKIEALLDALPVEHTKTRTWIDSEKFYQTVFSFALTERK